MAEALPQGKFLTGRVALVTGSAKRLGRTLAEGLAALGARVAVHYRHSADEAEAVVRAIAAAGGEAAAFSADVTNAAECERLVSAVHAYFGGLHVLVNNVGDYLERNVLDLELADWHAMIDSNLHSAFYMCHYALPLMRGQDYGRIVNIGFASTNAPQANVNATPYAIAKAGVLTLSKSLAVALAEAPITVNVVSPGVLENSVTHPPLRDVPRGRWGQPEELLSAIAYLLSPQADYVTGQHLEVAGGWAL